MPPTLPGPFRFIDLSLPLGRDMPCTWPGAVPFSHQVWNWFAPREEASTAGGPYSTHFIMIDEHCGTHMDGATHFIPPPDSGLPWAGPLGEESTERIALERLTGEARVVDVRALNDEDVPDGYSPRIEVARLERFEELHGRFEAGQAVLFQGGWDRHYLPGAAGHRYMAGPLTLRDCPGWPAPTPEAMLHLYDRGVRLIGTDAPSMGAVDDGAPVHWAGLSRGMLFIEGLCGLDQVPERGGLFVFMPLKVERGTGGPGRAAVLVDA
ncbi:cyclase family protein [Streptomyces sp. NPDC006385]|uniref:cyclase family protein n=1 Tax=Streptomyces sp. NPDC006385 TaxID=3156761 RepID=UPI00339DE140